MVNTHINTYNRVFIVSILVMENNIFYQIRFVPDKGYQILIPNFLGENWFSENNLEIEPVLIANKHNAVRKFNSFDYCNIALFRVFSELNHDESIISFANKYGLLGEKKSAGFAGSDALEEVELISYWKNNIFKFKSALTWWDKIESNDRDWLKTHIEWCKDENNEYFGVRYNSLNGLGGGWLAVKDHEPIIFEKIKHGDIYKPAKMVVQNFINDALTSSASGRLLFEENSTRLSLHIEPKTLLGFLWWQFAQAIEGSTKYRNCTTCQIPFRVQSERGNKKKFCSDACKSKNYRKKK